MGTKKTSTTTNQYDPGSMANYQNYQSTVAPLLQGFANNPFSNSQYSLNLSQNLAGSNQMGMNAIQNAMRNFNMTGLSSMGGAQQGLMSSLGRYGSAQNAQAFYGAANNAIARQNGAINSMMNYQPLQTGQQNVQQTSGLGTWLPQVVGAGIGLATGFMGGDGTPQQTSSQNPLTQMGGTMTNFMSPSFSSNFSSAANAQAPNPFSASMNGAQVAAPSYNYI